MYVDGGWEAARSVVLRLLENKAKAAQTTPGKGDFKTRLQEYAAVNSLELPKYEIETSGPDHGRRFVSTVRIGETIGEGQGTSKKQAQQRAAEDILGKLNAAREPATDDTDAAQSAAKGNDES